MGSLRGFEGVALEKMTEFLKRVCKGINQIRKGRRLCWKSGFLRSSSWLFEQPGHNSRTYP